ncbi:hypothetical protein P691DRAFT_791139 [Macrolepiota fuliginosa MF-IS2]|uniref:Uncharacterized protein n=1 Tax=Macrolepiota fuliginosa MF-IS2 TaxID=1400762 RepID=A0A9P5XEU1_9AGAR|nr:hypothetical protein P691DRAFT_791139 [Macrolepiota fuliginosa MF-IS2]
MNTPMASATRQQNSLSRLCPGGLSPQRSRILERARSKPIVIEVRRSGLGTTHAPELRAWIPTIFSLFKESSRALIRGELCKRKRSYLPHLQGFGMVLIYIPQHAPTELFLCSVHGAVAATSAPVLIPPDAPRLLTLSLSPPPNFSVPLEETYPLRLLSDLTTTQRDRLETIELTSPIHVHTSVCHIGTIMSSEAVNALGVFEYLQEEVIQPLDFDPTYSQLSQGMKGKVGAAFIDRCRGSSNVAVTTIWKCFASGQPVHSHCVPSGYDLLLGNGKVWGFESRSLGGYSVVHLDGN